MLSLLEFPHSKLYPEISPEIASELMAKLSKEFGVFLNIKILYGKAWIRLSANVNNVKEDYYKMRNRLAQALQINVYENRKWRREISREG